MAGEWYDGYHVYDQRIPLVAVGLRNLREHGPAGAVFWRFGRSTRQPLLEAIGNPRRDQVLARARADAAARQERYRAEQQRQAAQQAAEREARRPRCATCGARFTDDRWQAAEASPTPRGRWHPTLCEECEAAAIETAHQAEEQAQRERRAQQEAEAARAGRWFSRLRP